MNFPLLEPLTLLLSTKPKIALDNPKTETEGANWEYNHSRDQNF